MPEQKPLERVQRALHSDLRKRADSEPLGGPALGHTRTKPEDLDAVESQSWDQRCSELDQALKQSDGARIRHALSMLERLRYGCH